MTFTEQAEALFPTLQANRRHLHQHPELSFQEFETCAYIQQRLADLGIPYTVLATTGVVAHVGSGEKCVALRADIDALPIHEETSLVFASQNPGVMHACGHDTHTSMLLGAAQMLKERESTLGGVVKLIFQPGEEKTPGGASLMIADGALSNPAPSMIFGQHIDPDAPVGHVSFVSGPMMAAADELHFSIRGFGAHAAQPHLGRDPVFAATGLVHHLQSLITKHRNPLDPGVLTITAINGGHATNVIPDEVLMKGTLRSFDQSWREAAWAWLESQTDAYCGLHGCEGHLEISKGYPPVVNDEMATSFAEGVARDILGTDNVGPFEPKMWAEDFSYYGEHIPACFWMLGGRPLGVDQMPGLHNPGFSPEEQSMIVGATLLAEVATRALLTVGSMPHTGG